MWYEDYLPKDAVIGDIILYNHEENGFMIREIEKLVNGPYFLIDAQSLLYLGINYLFVRRQLFIQLAPGIRLFVIEYNPANREFLCYFGKFGLVLQYWARLINFMKLIKIRIILTLDVWKLAEVEPGTIPDWSDIKIWKKSEKF